MLLLHPGEHLERVVDVPERAEQPGLRGGVVAEAAGATAAVLTALRVRAIVAYISEPEPPSEC